MATFIDGLKDTITQLCALHVLRSELNRLLAEIEILSQFEREGTASERLAVEMVELKMPYLFNDHQTLATFCKPVVQKLCDLNVEIATVNLSLIGLSDDLLRDLCHAEIAVRETLDQISDEQDAAQ